MDTTKLDSIVLNALRLAARVYEANAKDPNLRTLHEAFKTDAFNVRQAIELIEVGEYLIIEKPSTIDDILRRNPILCSIEQRSALDTCDSQESPVLGPTSTAYFTIGTKHPKETYFADSSRRVSPTPRDGVDSAPPPLCDTPAATGNSGGVPLTDESQCMYPNPDVRTPFPSPNWKPSAHPPAAFYECAHGFAHPVGVPCTGECVP